MANFKQHNFRAILIQLTVVISALILIFLCYFAWQVLTLLFPPQPPPLPFSIQGWNSSMYLEDGTFAGTRLRMIDSLLESYDFHGWSLSEVEKLLGKSQPRSNRYGKNTVGYDLREGLHVLIFELDSQQKVVDYYVMYP